MSNIKLNFLDLTTLIEKETLCSFLKTRVGEVGICPNTFNISLTYFFNNIRVLGNNIVCHKIVL